MAADKKDMVDGWDRLGISPTSIGLVPQLLDVVWHMKPRLTMCLVGDTGIGKTPVVHQWCARMNGFMRVLNFGHMTQEEVSMIMFTEDASSFDFVAPEWLLELNREAEERGCAVLFLDEWNRSDKPLVNALFTLTDERRLHNYRLHENVLVVAAMNPSDGSYLVNEAEKDHAIRKRLNFVYTVHDMTAWLEHVKRSNWDPHVPAFIKAATTFLYDTGARDAGKAFPCPSNWEKVSNILLGARKAKIDLAGDAVTTLVEGQVGTVAARKFMEFVADQNTLIQPSEILNSYTPNSAVRKRVAALLNCYIDKNGEMLAKVSQEQTANRASFVVELCAGVALELFSVQAAPAKIAAHIALFIGDLPNEILQVFVAEHLKQAKESRGAEGQAYLNNLTNALGAYDSYKKKMKFITSAMRDYKLSAGLLPKI